MRKRLIGWLQFPTDTDRTTFYKESGSFICENHQGASTEDALADWAVWLNSPWSQSNYVYAIKANCVDGYTPMDPSEPSWRCEYTVVGYDAITSCAIGYGETEAEALAECQKLFQTLQRLYNKENASV